MALSKLIITSIDQCFSSDPDEMLRNLSSFIDSIISDISDSRGKCSDTYLSMRYGDLSIACSLVSTVLSKKKKWL